MQSTITDRIFPEGNLTITISDPKLMHGFSGNLPEDNFTITNSIVTPSKQGGFTGFSLGIFPEDNFTITNSDPKLMAN